MARESKQTEGGKSVALFNCVFFSYDITLFFNVGFFVVVGFFKYLFTPLIQDLHKFCRKPTYKE